MTTERSVEDRVRDWLTATAPGELQERVLADTFDLTRPMPQASGVRPWRNRTMRPVRLVIATGAVAIVLVAMVTTASFVLLQDSPGSPSSAQPMVWTPDAALRDWPGPLRDEAAVGPGRIHRVADSSDGVEGFDLVDGLGDSGAPDPWTDITHVKLGFGIQLQLAGRLPRVPDPAASWIAYGVVVDFDGDGTADQRIGIDNGVSGHREWITDLASGQTEVNLTSSFGAFGAFGTRIETWFVNDGNEEAAAILVVKPTNRWSRFYVWASSIRDGGIVSTDFAPDAGWIERGSP